MRQRRTETYEKPRKVLHLADENGQGWFYNYDIQEETRDGKQLYAFVQLCFAGEPTANECIERIIRQYITQNEEFDLINSWNKAAMGLLAGEEREKAENEYKQYFAVLENIKRKVRTDFAEYEAAKKCHI